MQLSKIKKFLIAPIFALSIATPSLGGNDSVAMVYLNNVQQTQQYKLETAIFKGDYGITIVVRSRSTFANIAGNYRELYVSSTHYKGWVKGLQLVGNVIHGRTSNGYQVAISTY
jgi:hypothetical protein